MKKKKKVINVHVTSEDILDGKRESGLACPVARAISRAVGKSWAVIYYAGIAHPCYCAVSAGDVSAGDVMNIKARCQLSEKVSSFVASFDRNKPVEPFSFELVLREEEPANAS